MSHFTFSLLLFWTVATCGAQTDSTLRADSVKRLSRVQTKIRVGADLSRIFLTLTQSRFSGAEASLDLNRNRIFYEAHLGFAEQSRALTNYTPVSKGIYYSVGIGKNVFAESDNILLGGLRLAGSSFRYQPQNVKIENPVTGNSLSPSIKESECSAYWVEVVGSMRAHITGWILMGFEVRFKGMIQTSTNGYTPYAIPGYGLYRSKTSLGFNYFIYLNLPTQK